MQMQYACWACHWATTRDATRADGGTIYDKTIHVNGTYDIMGNMWEWMEGPDRDETPYGPAQGHGVRGGGFHEGDYACNSTYVPGGDPISEYNTFGFRVATVPEPCSLALLSLSAMALLRRRRA